MQFRRPTKEVYNRRQFYVNCYDSSNDNNATLQTIECVDDDNNKILRTIRINLSYFIPRSTSKCLRFYCSEIISVADVHRNHHQMNVELNRKSVLNSIAFPAMNCHFLYRNSQLISHSIMTYCLLYKKCIDIYIY